MPQPRKQFGFRLKVLLLAVALVATMEVLTLVPVLGALKHDSEASARQTVDVASGLLDEYLHNRAEQLLTAVNGLVADYGFKHAAADGDQASIRSALVTYATRIGAPVAALLDVDGAVLVSTTQSAETIEAGFSPLPPGESVATAAHRVIFIGGTPYQTATMPLRAPVTVGWVMLGLPIDDALASRLGDLTGLDVSFVHFTGSAPQIVASTLPRAARAAALAGLDANAFEAQQTGTADSTKVSLLRPFLNGASGVHVALQLSLHAATESYRNIRAILLVSTLIALLLAVSGSYWLANMVTRPVHNLVAAAGRMREGVYDEPIEVRSADELGELAGSFNAMQHAIAAREQHIVHQAHHDSLTGLPNRELTISMLREALNSGVPYAIVSFGIDRLSGIVSSLGHRAGDELVKLAAGVLRTRLGDEHALGHFSSNELVVCLRGFTVQQATEWIAVQAELLRSGVRLGDANVSLQTTAGIALFPEHGRDAAELCRRASSARTDALLHHEPVGVYESGQEDLWRKQIRIVGDFPQAIANGELRLAVQPKIDCRTREVMGVEALVRWQHPDFGFLYPDAFVGPIEQAGAIGHLSRWALRESIACSAAWRAQGVALSVAINLSVDDLTDEYLPYYLLDLVKRHSLEPRMVTLEVTESAIMRNVHQALAVVRCVRELGFRIAIDDFGTGQSALAQLKRLPVDELKIDKSFVMNMKDARDEAILRATIDLGHQLGLSVVAEGVENELALERLAALGCDYAQGYYIAKPILRQDFLGWLAQRRTGRTADVVPFVPRLDRPLAPVGT